MAETPTLLETVMAYCRIDAEDTALVQSLLDAAEAFVINGMEYKVKEDLEALPLFVLACKMLIACWFDNRITEPDGPAALTPYGFAGIMTQLRNWQPEASA